MKTSDSPKIHEPAPHRKSIGIFHPAYVLATWFGCGKIPVASGTWGSLGALPFAYAIHSNFGGQILMMASLVAFLVGIAATKIYMTARNTPHDPREIVIDEVAGQWLLLSVLPCTLLAYAIGFIAFRLFDIFKPWPISILDEKVPGAFGVMIDDLAAGAIPALLFSLFVLYCNITGCGDLVEQIDSFLNIYG